MKKQKSQKQSFIAQFFFAVYPFSISFQDQDYSNYRLYFEKSKKQLYLGLQILNKFDIPQHPPAENKFIYFAQPEQIQSFRILAERNLAFKWSLYNGTGAEGEEFIQSHTIHLASFWNDLLVKKENMKPYEIVFKKSRCRLFYLVTAGNNQQIHENIQKYFRVSSPNHQALGKQQHLQQQTQQVHNSAKISTQNKNGNGNQLRQKEKIKSSTPLAEHIEIEEPNSPTSNVIFSDTASKFLNPLPHSKLKSEAKLYSSINEQLLSKSEPEGVGETINSQLRLALSLEEIQISKQIEQRIKQNQSPPHSSEKQRQAALDRPPSVQEQLLVRYHLQKSQRITSSQKLNDKGEIVVTPIYYHLKYYIIFIAIIAIFTGLVFMNPQTNTYHSPPQPHATTKKAKSKAADRRRRGKQGKRRE